MLWKIRKKKDLLTQKVVIWVKNLLTQKVVIWVKTIRKSNLMSIYWKSLRFRF